MKNKQIIVLAHNRRDAAFYATSIGLDPMEWYYAFDERSLMGVKDIDVVVYETFWHKRWGELYPIMQRLRALQQTHDIRVHYADDANSDKVRTAPPLLV